MYLAGRRKTINKQHLRSQKTIQKEYIPWKIPFSNEIKVNENHGHQILQVNKL